MSSTQIITFKTTALLTK